MCSEKNLALKYLQLALQVSTAPGEFTYSKLMLYVYWPRRYVVWELWLLIYHIVIHH